jgi:hypothetical protein
MEQKNCPLRTNLEVHKHGYWIQREFGGGCQESTSLSNTRLCNDSHAGYAIETLEANVLPPTPQENENRATAAEFNDKRKNDKNKENEMELIVTYGVEVS